MGHIFDPRCSYECSMSRRLKKTWNAIHTRNMKYILWNEALPTKTRRKWRLNRLVESISSMSIWPRGNPFFEFSSWMRSGLTNSGWEGMQMKKLRVKKKSMRGWSRWCINHRCKWRVKLNKWKRNGKNDWYGINIFIYFYSFFRNSKFRQIHSSEKIFLKLCLIWLEFFFRN